MHSLFPVISSAILVVLLGLVNLLLMWRANRIWWNNPAIRRWSMLLPLLGLVFVAIWGFAEWNQLRWLAFPAMFLAGIVFVTESALLLSLPISGLIHFVNWLWDRLVRHKSGTDETVDTQRRRLLKSAAAAVPAATVALAIGGKISAFADIRVFLRPLAIPHLPDHLAGLRILQISDLHLRSYVNLDSIPPLIEAARPFAPDLVLLTGDIADDYRQLPDALRLIAELSPRLGCYATLGNHEYYRGAAEAISIYNRGPIPLFINEGTRLQVGGGSLFLGGIDDPHTMRDLPPDFFDSCLKTTLRTRSAGDFTVIMSHRPGVLDAAPDYGVGLSLAGHTHGGQMGFMGQSVFEPLMPDVYLWGEYRRQRSVLYTTCGAGHWFPFRLGCPAEAPVLELTQA